jgi:hypothetical protein
VNGPSSKAPTQKAAAPNKAAKKLAASKMVWPTALTAAMAKVPPESADAREVVDESPTIDVAPESYVDMLNDASVDIFSPALADYSDNNDGLEEGLKGEDFEEEEDVIGEEEDELEECKGKDDIEERRGEHAPRSTSPWWSSSRRRMPL